MILYALDLDAFRIAKGRDSARHLQQVAETFVAGHFVNRRALDVAGDGCDRTDYRHEDHVARLEADIGAGIAVQQHVVQVDVHRDFAVAAQFDPAQRPHLVDAAGRYQRVGHMRQRANRIEPGLLHLTDHEYLDGADLTHRHTDFDAGDLAHAAFDEFLGLAEGQTPDLDRTDLLNHHRAVAIDLELDGLIDPSPDVHVELVIGADDVIVTDRNVSERREGGDAGGEKIVAKLFERTAGRCGEQLVRRVELVEAGFDSGSFLLTRRSLHRKHRRHL